MYVKEDTKISDEEVAFVRITDKKRNTTRNDFVKDTSSRLVERQSLRSQASINRIKY